MKGGKDDRKGGFGERGGKGGGKKGGGKKGKRRTEEQTRVEKSLEMKQGVDMDIASPHFEIGLTGKVVTLISISFRQEADEEAQSGPTVLGLKESDPKWEDIMRQVQFNLLKQMKSEDVNMEELRSALVVAGNVMYLRSPQLAPEEGFTPFTMKVRLGRKLEEYVVSPSMMKDVELSLDDAENLLAVKTMTQNIVTKVLRMHYAIACPKTKKLLNAGTNDGSLTIMKGVRPRVCLLQDDEGRESMNVELEPCVKVTTVARLPDLLRDVKWEQLLGSTVLTPHNNVLYKFRKLQKENAGNTKFTAKGRELSLVEYFKERHNIVVPADDKVVEVKTAEGRRCELPASLCCSDHLSADQKATLPGTCSLQPQVRFEMLEEATKFLAEEKAKQELEKWGIEIKTGGLKRHIARRLEPVMLTIGNAKPEKCTSDFGIGLSRFRYESGLPRSDFEVFVAGSDRRTTGDAANRWNEINREMNKVGAPFGTRNKGEGDGSRGLERELQGSGIREGDYVFAALAQGDKFEYAEIKEWCIKNGVFSQCQNMAKTGNAKNMRIIVANFAKQMCHKKGLLSWWAPIDQTVPALAKKTVMIVGVDVNRLDAEMSSSDSGKFTRENKSFAGFVAWVYDPSAQGALRWKHYCDVVSKTTKDSFYMEAPDENRSASAAPSEAGSKSSGQNFVSTGSKMHDFLVAAGNSFRERGVNTIDEIIVMRDGGSLSNLEVIEELENRQLQDASMKTDVWGTKPATTFMVLNKRPSCRFLGDAATTKSANIEGSGLYNVPRGLVVDSLKEAEAAVGQTFWLVPHSCNLSTTIPIKYVVLSQEDGDSGSHIDIKDLPKLCFDLGYMYPNWTDAVKVCSSNGANGVKG